MARAIIDLESIVLKAGNHDSIEEGMCVMEMVSYLANEPWSDHPACVSPVLGVFLRAWNDALDDDTRQKLKPYARRVIGTAGDGKDEARAWMCVDWLARIQAPAWLDLAGLSQHAGAVRALAAIASPEAAKAGQPALEAAGEAAGEAAREAAGEAAREAAWEAAREAAWEAAGEAAGEAAWEAAREAAWEAAGEAAREAAWGAAGEAAGEAAWARLAPTVIALQISAFTLLDRMVG
jgi:hypothetical protein